jgi:hypothetical protein
VLLDAVLPNGAVVKVAATLAGGAQDVSFLQALSLDNLQKALAGFVEMASNAVDKVAPDTMEIEFGLGLSVEGGKLISLLTDAGSEASLTVRLRWDRKTRESPSEDRAVAASER